MSLERMRSPVNSSWSACCFYTKAFLKVPTVGRHPPATPQFSKSVCFFLLPHITKRICHWLPWLYVTGKRYPPDSIFSSDFHCPLLHKWKNFCHLTMTRSMPGCVSVNGKCSSSARYCWTAIGNLAGVREPLVWCPVPTQINICSRCRVLLTLSRN
jgi:hypothetical protein